jgi:hypothetical protein
MEARQERGPQKESRAYPRPAEDPRGEAAGLRIAADAVNAHLLNQRGLS